jgi:hypothetical protein
MEKARHGGCRKKGKCVSLDAVMDLAVETEAVFDVFLQNEAVLDVEVQDEPVLDAVLGGVVVAQTESTPAIKVET